MKGTLKVDNLIIRKVDKYKMWAITFLWIEYSN